MSIKIWFSFLFCVLRPAKHKRRWGHNLQGAHFLLCFDRCSDYFTENTSWSCKLWQNNAVPWKHPSFSENIWKLPFWIIWTTDYSKGFLLSLALRIIKVWLYRRTWQSPWLGYYKDSRKTKILLANVSLIKVEIIGERFPWSIMQYFWPALSDNCFLSIWEWLFYTGFTVF